MRFGRTIYPEKSRFISEINEEYLEYVGGFMARQKPQPRPVQATYSKPANPNPSLHKLVKPSIGLGAMASDDASRVKVGDIIEHSHFGIGKVVELLDAPSGRQMKVDFKSHGVKLMILKFVKFKIIG